MNRTKLIIGMICIAVASCTADKNAELSKLKSQHNALAEKIATLEKELANDSSNVPEIADAKKVLVQELSLNGFNHYTEVQGKLDGEDNVGVNAKMNGIVDAIYVTVGQSVTAGQVLAKLDDAAMQKGLTELETGVAFATDMYNKQKNLWEQKIGSEIQYLSAKNTKEQLEQKRASLKEQIEMTRIKAPVSGTIEDSPLKVGQIANPMSPAFRIVNFGRIKVVADIAEGYSSKIHAGDKVNIFFPDLEKEVSATLSFSSKYINPINRSFSVEARINTAIDGLKANMVAVLRVTDYSNKMAISIPINYTLSEGDKMYVFVAKQEAGLLKAVKKLIKTGQTYNGAIEVIDGLNAGDKLIISGYQDLENGQAIQL